MTDHANQEDEWTEGLEKAGWATAQVPVPEAAAEAARALLPGTGGGGDSTTSFPFLDHDLCGLVLSDPVLALARKCLGPDIRLANATLQVRRALPAGHPVVQRHHNQAWGRNTFVPPASDWRKQNLLVVVYLSDVVDADDGPVVVAEADASEGLPLLVDGHTAYPEDQFPGLYAGERPVLGPAGTAVVLPGPTVRRDAPIRRSDRIRASLYLLFHASDVTWLERANWAGSPAAPNGPYVGALVDATAWDDLAVLGLPRRSSEFWDETTTRIWDQVHGQG